MHATPAFVIFGSRSRLLPWPSGGWLGSCAALSIPAAWFVTLQLLCRAPLPMLFSCFLCPGVLQRGVRAREEHRGDQGPPRPPLPRHRQPGPEEQLGLQALGSLIKK